MLLSVGELNENKNHRIIIKAIAKLNDPKIHYAIAGKGDMSEYLADLSKQLGVSDRVHLLGYRKDIAELNHSADVFCFPSKREGLGLAAIEAMACGLPVIAAENRGTREFIVSHKNGFLCNFNDADAFASAIKALIDSNELSQLLSENAVSAVKKFSVENVVNIMKGIYK